MKQKYIYLLKETKVLINKFVRKKIHKSFDVNDEIKIINYKNRLIFLYIFIYFVICFRKKEIIYH